MIGQEQEELGVMLEKKTFLDCNISSVKTDVNGADSLSHEKHNGSSASVNSNNENDIAEFLVKTEDNARSSSMSLCDGHLNIGDSICTISNSLSSTMDIKTSSTTNMCSSSCATTCSSSQDTCAVTSSANTDNCGSSVNCNSSTVSTSTPNLTPRDSLQDGM